MTTKTDRNTSICHLYKEGGLTLGQLGQRFHLSRERIRQIVKRAGLTKDDRTAAVSIADEFLGVNIPKDVKLALRKEAHKRGLSMSSVTAKTLREMLTSCGYKLQGNKIVEVIT